MKEKDEEERERGKHARVEFDLIKCNYYDSIIITTTTNTKEYLYKTQNAFLASDA